MPRHPPGGTLLVWRRLSRTPSSVGKYLHDGSDQGLFHVMRGPISIPFSYAPHKEKVHEIEILESSQRY